MLQLLHNKKGDYYMITTNYYKFYITSLFDVNVENEITENEFIDLVNKFRSQLKPEWGTTYKKYHILDNGNKSGHYLVKRLVGVKEYE